MMTVGVRQEPPPDVAEGWLDETPPRPDFAGRVNARVVRTRHRGRGGRWVVWLARIALWVLLGLLVALGARTLLNPAPTVVVPQPADARPETVFPRQAAEAFAVRFASVYLEWDSADPQTRADRLAGYVPDGADRQMGWSGSGKQVAVLVLPVQTVVISEVSAIVTVAAEVTGTTAPRWVHLSVPVYTDGQGRFAVTDVPAFVPGPGEADPPSERVELADGELVDQLREPLTAFFRGYAGGSQGELDYLLAPGAEVGTLDGVVELAGLRLSAPRGGDHRNITAEVQWVDPVTQSTFTQTYQVTVAKGQDGRWYIEQLGAQPVAARHPNQEK